MQIPYLTETKSGRAVIDAFGGYDHRPLISENYFYNMENMSGDAYPALTPRAPRGVRKTPDEVQAMLSGTVLTYVAGNKLYVKDEPVMTLTDREPKKLVAMGAYIVVFPDRVYYNTADPEDHGSMEAANGTSGTVTYKIADGEGTAYDIDATGGTAPSNPANGMKWLDTGGATPSLKMYSEATGVWTSVLSTTVRIEAAGIGRNMKAGDGVRISGLPAATKPLNHYNGQDVLLEAAGDDWIALVGIMDAASKTDSARVSVSRTLPVLDHVCECGNRLWGCRYGEDADGKFVNEIYASALGDFKNWRQYRGVSTDSYAASVGAEGAWTGCIAYQGMPHFFKNDRLFRVYGAYPAAYQVTELACRGVQEGAAESMAILNERLFYKSRSGVCVYDGAYPTEISDVFGEVKYIWNARRGRPSAAAGAADNKYYISMLSEEDGAYHLFCYDMRLGLWYREDNTFASQFALEDGRLVYLDGETGEVRTLTGGDYKVNWMLETGVLGMSQPSSSQAVKRDAVEQKYISRITLRMALEIGSRVMVYVQYDSKPEWIHVATVEGMNLRTFTLPIRPQRCDHFRLRLCGTGGMRLYSISKTLEYGSEDVV